MRKRRVLPAAVIVIEIPYDLLGSLQSHLVRLVVMVVSRKHSHIHHRACSLLLLEPLSQPVRDTTGNSLRQAKPHPTSGSELELVGSISSAVVVK